MVMVNGRSLPQDEWHRKYYWDLRKNAWNCARCSICKWVDSWEVKDPRFAKVCPSSQYYLFDAYSCQGRMDISLALIDGRLKYDDSPGLLNIYYRCNTCGGCDAACKRVQDMEPLRVMIEMRTRLVADGQLLPQHIPLIENLRREDNMLMEKKAGRGRWADGLAVKDLTRDKAEYAFHAGCRSSFDHDSREATRAAVSLLTGADLDIGIMGSDEACCGGRAYSMGYHGEFTKYAEHNIESWSRAGVKTVVTSCADCYYAIKRLYPDLGAKFEVLHVIEFIDRLLQQGKITYRKSLPARVTYHDPCHIGRRLSQAPGFYIPGQPIMGLYEEPRHIISSIPGIELVEMARIKEYAWCCGAGGGVLEAYPEFNHFTATERIREAVETGASALVTACPWCKRSLSDAATSLSARLEVLDIVEVLQRVI
ncbi:MAG: (Fe-S)-binding protein [Chloroflexota bacterium]